MHGLGNRGMLVYNSGMDDWVKAKFEREPDEHRRIERPENPERQPQRAPERKREDFPEPERKETKPERRPEKVPA